jgi:hypothetical protein
MTTTKKGRGRPKKNSSKESEVIEPDKSKKETKDTGSAVKENPEQKKESNKSSNTNKEPEIDFGKTEDENIETVQNRKETESNKEIEPETDIEMSKEAQDFDIEDAEVIANDYSPLNPDVIHRGYESGSAQMTQTSTEEGMIIPEAELTFSDENQASAEKAKQNKETTENESGGQQNTQSAQQVTKTEPKREEKSYFSNEHSKSTETTTETPAEKRRNATKMADTLLMIYRENVPVLFKYFAQFNEGKISQMELDGEFDRAMPVLADGTTAGEYITSVNRQVDATFVITDAQVLEVREPLIDWLMEKDLKLTPAQRLGIAIGGQMVSFGLATLKQWQQNRHALNKFAEFHADWKGMGKGDIPNQRNVKSDYAPTEESRPRPEEQRQTPMDNISDLDVMESNNMMPNNSDLVDHSIHANPVILKTQQQLAISN